VAVAPSSYNGKYNCSSSFVNDIMFSHNGPNGPESKATLRFVEFACRRGTNGEVAVYDCIIIIISSFIIEVVVCYLHMVITYCGYRHNFNSLVVLEIVSYIIR